MLGLAFLAFVLSLLLMSILSGGWFGTNCGYYICGRVVHTRDAGWDAILISINRGCTKMDNMHAGAGGRCRLAAICRLCFLIHWSVPWRY